MKLKLAERMAGEDRLLVACIYDYIPSSGDNLYYLEMTRVVIDREKSFRLLKEFAEKCPYPIDRERMIGASFKLYRKDKPYHGKTLKVYNSNDDGGLMPCSNAPEMEISKEELLEWEKEFAGEKYEDSKGWKRRGWFPFSKEMFLKVRNYETTSGLVFF